MNVSLVSAGHQSLAAGRAENHEVQGAPDHDGDGDDGASASAAGKTVRGPSLNGNGDVIGTRINTTA